MADLALACTLSTPGGPLSLENEAGGYELHREALQEVSATWRRHTISNQWVAGSFTIGAVKENVEQPLSVWVTAATGVDLKARVRALCEALEQLQFTLTFTEDGETTVWSCQMADYGVRTEQSFRVARHALVTARIPALPQLVGV